MKKLIVDCDNKTTQEIEMTTEEIANLPQLIDKTSAELRQEAYRTDKMINWQSNIITVDEAINLFTKYFAENHQNSEVLRSKIIVAKAEIRELYPDI
jgi:hypothetical protein